MAFNLDSINLNEDGSEMPVLHPVTMEPLLDENGQAATIRLAGMDSAAYRKATNAITNKRIKGGKLVKFTAERIESDALDLICECTLQWSGITVDGEVPKTAKELYSGRKWLRDQADAWIHDRANYLGN